MSAAYVRQPAPDLDEVRRRTVPEFPSIARAMAAIALSGMGDEPAEDLVRRAWPTDAAALLTVRAAVTPTALAAGASWATVVVGSFLSTFAPQSAAVRLFARAMKLDFAGVHTFTIPRVATAPVPVFIAEGAPMPVAQIGFQSSTIGPVKKLLVGSAITNELEFTGPENAATIIGNVLSQQAAISLDAAVFDNAAASALRPAGLLNGVAALTATTGGGLAALAEDLSNLSAAIADAGGNPDTVMLFASAGEAMRLRLLAGRAFSSMLIATSALDGGTVVAVAPDLIAHGFDGLPQIDASKVATMHFEDASPQPIVTAGTPNVVAAPVRSSFQQDLTFVRVRLKTTWGKLSPGAVQVVGNVTW